MYLVEHQHPVPEVAVHQRQGPVPVRDQADDRGLHPGGTGSCVDELGPFFVLEDIPRKAHRLLEHRIEFRAHVRELRTRHDLPHAHGEVGWPRNQEKLIIHLGRHVRTRAPPDKKSSPSDVVENLRQPVDVDNLRVRNSGGVG